MITEHDIMRERLLNRKGLSSKPKPDHQRTLAELEKEWSEDFERLMRNRLMMGALRYGGLRNPKNPGKTTNLNTEQILKRAQLYVETGNGEHLVDVANFALAEFVQQRHPKYHFKSIDRHD